MTDVLAGPALELDDAEVPLAAVFCGSRWSWCGFGVRNGAWRARRWGPWPLRRLDTYLVAVRPEDEQRVRGTRLAAASLNVPANARVELWLPEAV